MFYLNTKFETMIIKQKSEIDAGCLLNLALIFNVKYYLISELIAYLILIFTNHL